MKIKAGKYITEVKLQIHLLWKYYQFKNYNDRLLINTMYSIKNLCR